MRIQRIIQQVYYEPMLITEEGHASIRKVIESKLANNYLSVKDALKVEDSPQTDFFGEPLPVMEITDDGLAIIPINGPIVKRASMLEKSCGVCDIDTIWNNTEAALASDKINTIVYDINSPGGTVTSVPDFASYLVEVGQQKNTVAYIGELGASAAWWIASAANEIYALSTARILSVGVYSYALNTKKYYQDMGVDVKVFQSGDLKGIGIEGTDLTKEQEKYLQEEVDKIGVMFRGFVKEQMPQMPEGMMRGQTLMAMEVSQVVPKVSLVNKLEDIFDVV